MVVDCTYIMRNDVWDIVPRPKGKLVVSSRWLYKIKHFSYGSIDKFKARFVEREFSQKEVVDWKEIFSPVAKYDSIRVVIYIALVMRWRIHHMDVKTTFLDMIIEEEVTQIDT
jgi:hypothetical protein